MLSKKELLVKRIFDFTLSLFLISILFIPILLLVFLAVLIIGDYGFFRQERIGRYGKKFKILKIRTERGNAVGLSKNKSGISGYGQFLRKSKLNELPQLFNILIGQMSFVGPRPDVPGFADKLNGEDAIILKILPGLTGPASIKYRNEESLLLQQKNPEKYNREIIWPDKISINKEYIVNWSFKKDIGYLYKTLFK